MKETARLRGKMLRTGGEVTRKRDTWNGGSRSSLRMSNQHMQYRWGAREGTGIMANNSKSKLKLLYLKRILEEETDERRGLSMT